jgi:hypothetical protein
VVWPDAFEFLAPSFYKKHQQSLPFSRSEVSDMLYLLLALVSLAITAGSYMMYRNSGGSTLYLVGIIVFLLATVGCFGLFLSGRVNKNEDIHITE